MDGAYTHIQRTRRMHERTLHVVVVGLGELSRGTIHGPKKPYNVKLSEKKKPIKTLFYRLSNNEENHV